jgi:ribosome-binding factor A
MAARFPARRVEDLAFEATGELQVALNEAYIKLLELAYDCDAGLHDQRLSDEMQAVLQQSLDEIIRCSDPPFAEGHQAFDFKS